MDFPSALTKAMKSRGLWDEKVAVDISVSAQTVSKWRTGRARPRRMARVALERLFPELSEVVDAAVA